LASAIVAAQSALTTSVRAQSFVLDLGGTGANGPLVITTTMSVPLPANGVFQATMVDVAPGAVLSFIPNAHNAGVTIVSQGDIVIDGRIDVSGAPGTNAGPGAGGPGGWAGGTGSRNYLDPVIFGRCPSFNTAAYYYQVGYVETVYGSCGGNGSRPSSGTCPLPGGNGGGGGGGLVLISHTAIRSSQPGATIDARGGAPSGARSCTGEAADAGRDGTVFLVAPLMSAATLTVRGDAYMQRIIASGDPSFTRLWAAGNAMIAYRDPVSVSVVSINGVSLPAGSETATFNFGSATTATIVVEADGCTGGRLTPAFSISNIETQLVGTVISSGGCTVAPMATYNPAPAATTTTWTCTLPAGQSFTGFLDAWADCQLP
jgi:hypothetical protein